MSKTKKLPDRKKIALELLHQRLGHRSTRSLLAGDTDNVWEGIELRIDPDPFCTSCQISSMNKKDRSKIPKLCGMEKITTEEVMDKLDIFQSRFGEIDKFVW